MTDAWQSIKVRRFEHVTAGPVTSLLRVDGKPPWRRGSAQRPTLLVDGAGEPQRFAALPAPPDPRGLLRAAYSVPSAMIAPESRFWLEHPDGSLTELPQPTPGASRGDHTEAAAPPPEAAAAPDLEEREPPDAPETERRADVHAKLAEQSGALAESERAAAENEWARRAAEAELKRARAEMEALEHRLADAQTTPQEHGSADTDAEQQLAEAQNRLTEAETAAGEAHSLLTAAESRAAEADARAAEADSRATQADSRATQADSRATQAESHATQAEARAAEAEQRAAEAEQRAAEAEERAAEAEQQAARTEEEVAQAESAAAELAAALEDAEEARAGTRELERITGEQQERIKALERQLAEVQPEQLALKRELQALRSSRASVEQELDQARDQLRVMTFERDELSRQAAAFDGVAIKARERASKAEATNARLTDTMQELQTWRGELERRLASTTSELGVAKAARQADERELKRLRELLADTGPHGEHVDVLGGESSQTLAAQASEIELLMAEVATLRAGRELVAEGPAADPEAVVRIAALEAERAEIARRATELSVALAQALEPARMLAELAEGGQEQPGTDPEVNLELISSAAERTAREQAERELGAAAREASSDRRDPG